MEKLSLVMGFNSTDITYGWNGKMAGFTLMFSHFTDVLPEQGQSFPLSPGLIPIAKFQTIEEKKLG